MMQEEGEDDDDKLADQLLNSIMCVNIGLVLLSNLNINIIHLTSSVYEKKYRLKNVQKQ